MWLRLRDAGTISSMKQTNWPAKAKHVFLCGVYKAKWKWRSKRLCFRLQRCFNILPAVPLPADSQCSAFDTASYIIRTIRKIGTGAPKRNPRLSGGQCSKIITDCSIALKDVLRIHNIICTRFFFIACFCISVLGLPSVCVISFVTCHYFPPGLHCNRQGSERGLDCESARD